jgi:AbrB family looped-hinge helix DNA binding protein
MSIASLRRRMADVRETAWARIEQLRGRSRVFDLGFAVVNRDRLIASSVLSAFVAFRLFVFLIPYVYVLVAGLGFYSESRPGGTEDLARDVGFAGVVAADIADALQTSDRGRWFALVAGTLALSWASLGVSRSLHSVNQVAWRLPRRRMPTSVTAVVGPLLLVTAFMVTTGVAAAVRERSSGAAVAVTVATFVVYAALWLAASITLPRAPGSPWGALLPGAVLTAVGLQVLHVVVVYYFVDRLGRASAVYGALGVALVVLAWLFLLGQLTVAAAELDAAIWEQRAVRARAGGSRARIDPDGRLWLPPSVRDELGLEAGDQLDVESEEGSVRLTRAREEEPLPPP